MSFLEVTAFLFDGFLISLLIFAVTLICGAPLGLPIAFCSMSRFKPLRAVSKTVVWIVRGIPLMLQIFIIYYVPGLLFDKPIFGLSSASTAIRSKKEDVTSLSPSVIKRAAL